MIRSVAGTVRPRRRGIALVQREPVEGAEAREQRLPLVLIRREADDFDENDAIESQCVFGDRRGDRFLNSG